MAVVKCPNNHFYDNEKFTECPHCKKGMSPNADPGDNNKTWGKFTSGGNTSTVPLEANNGGAADDTGKTVSIFGRDVNPVAGWLVCIDGENRGRSFEVHLGKNYVGRSMKSDIRINDPKVSRENHFSIIFDPRSARFFVTPGENMVYLRDEMLTSSKEMCDGDVIVAGGSTFIFIPYCTKERTWDTEEENNEDE